MLSVNTNMNSQIAINSLAQNQRDMSTAMERLSTGKRINSSSDDAAGLKIASRMTTQIQGLDMALTNATHAISMVETTEGGIREVSNMLHRMRELAVNAQNGTNHSEDIDAMQTEFAQLQAEIERIADNTQYNGINVLNSSDAVTFAIGAYGETLSVNMYDFQTDDASAAYGVAIDTSSIAVTSGSAADALTAIDTAIAGTDTARASLGAALNRLNYAVDSLSNTKVNAEASRSRVLDTDYAKETSELARTQIIQQAATAMLAQANMTPQNILALLKG